MRTFKNEERDADKPRVKDPLISRIERLERKVARLEGKKEINVYDLSSISKAKK